MRLFSSLMLVTGLAPILAPLVGGQLLAISSWEGIFISLSILSALIAMLAALGLKETLPPERRVPSGLRRTLQTMAGLLQDRSFVGNALAGGLTFGALFAYISGSPFVLQGIYGLSPQVYSLAFAMNGLGLVAASQVNARIVERVGPTRLLRRALVCVVAAAFALLVVVSVGGLPVWAVLVPMFAIVSSIPFVLPNSTALALANHAAVAGTASALLGLIQFMVGAFAAPLVGVAGPDTAVPMGVIMVDARARRARRPALRGAAAAVEPRAMTLVTISAAYGAGGSVIAPALAERLGVPFLGRPPAPDVVDPGAEARACDESGGSGPGRLLSRFASLAVSWGTPAGMTLDELLPDQALRLEIEQEIHDLAAKGAGVILGRGAAVILHDDERALHVLLDGPREARVRQAMEIEGIDHDLAEHRLTRVDRFRRAYIDTLYGVDLRETGICHLVLDSTAIPLDDCVELIAAAAEARASRRR